MQRRLTDAKDRLLDKIVDHAVQTAAGNLGIDVARFVRQYYRNVSAEDLKQRNAADLSGAALTHLNFARERTPGKPGIRIFNPAPTTHGWESTHTIVEMTNNDMPFLVDSTCMALNRHGMTIHLTIHPVINVRRNKKGELLEVLAADEATDDSIRESLMHIEIDRETDPKIFKRLTRSIEIAMRDVRAAVDDWKAMRQKAIDVCNEIDENPPPLNASAISEGKALLEWMADDNFTFLGYREYELEKGKEEDILKPKEGTSLGILRNPPPETPPKNGIVLASGIRRQARSKDLLVLTKANSESTVHRPAYLDYIGVKIFKGSRVIGEKRFLGLFTSVAYNRSPREIPLLRHKVQQVMARSGLAPTSHGGKAMLHILDTFPRDELVQASIEDLSRIAHGIYHLQERQRVKLFIRRDAFRRFFSCLVYVPREKYNTDIRQRIEAILTKAFGGISVESTAEISESKLARVHIIVRTTPVRHGKVNVAEVERRIIDAVRTWEDELKDTLIERFDEERGLKLSNQYSKVFPSAFREDVSPREASFDIERIASLPPGDKSLRMSLYRPPTYPKNHLRFKLFHRDEPIPLSDALPMLENMGLRVIGEQPYRCRLGDESVVWVQDFEMEYELGATLVPSEVNQIFQDTFARIWRRDIENDEFNRMVLSARLTWRHAALLRAYCRYLMQTGMPFSLQYVAKVLNRNAGIARMLVDLFHCACGPDESDRSRKSDSQRIRQELDKALESVSSLDEDRILRGYAALIRATLRTNFFQTDSAGEPKRYISLKLDPREVPNLPLPRPRYEVFVYAPHMEGVHLRGGKVARGGIRWSDRREDFRTEVLGLMKAQSVKNTVIVPVGAKGGFVCKDLPVGDRDSVMAEVVACYKDFIGGLLDVTDNIVDGEIVSAPNLVRRDGDDPYLVVAADKGTATFSDIANEVAASYDFWLGDAFASGGSAGYDHKKMGITARGAWEAVKRHFREMAIDIQAQDFSVVGIGDMSGDVFGNGMLLSKHIRLRAAFNHLHIFLDPDPDPEASFEERQRLFDLPRSTWMDYNARLISDGGGIYSRQEKHIALTPEVKNMLGVNEDALTPQELIRAILRMPVDLLWNGGIGTYIKASHESHGDVGDRANDAVRVDACELHCKVIGEGGNLGLTQSGRIEYALHDGRINTDSIDNSAGVDCSDHEVNIKILLNLVAQEKPLTPSRRNRLLEAMTEEVAELVLKNNYLQTQAISMLEAHAVERVNEHGHLLAALGRTGDLDREFEFLPDDEAIDERRKSGTGFTRPELAILLSYSKLTLYRRLIKSDVPEDAYLSRELERYFPQPLQKHYSELMDNHRLSREIIATQITNSLINRMGPAFALRMEEETGADAAAIARAYTIAREIFAVRDLWADIEQLDNKVHANVQYSMMFQTTRLLKHATRWLLSRYVASRDIAAAVSNYQPGVARLLQGLPDLLVGPDRKAFEEAAQLYTDIGVPQVVARRMAALNAMYSALDIVEVAKRDNADVDYIGSVYFEVGRGLKLDWIRDQIDTLHVEGHWQAMARGSLREDLYRLQRNLTAQLVAGNRGRSAEETVVTWLGNSSERVRHARQTLSDMKSMGKMDFPTLSVALQEIRKLTEA